MWKRLRLSVYSDSQGRSLGPKIKKRTPSELQVMGTVMPNAGLIQVADSALQSKENIAVLIGGTNDTLRKDFLPIY